MYESHGVYGIHRKDDLCRVELGPFLGNVVVRGDVHQVSPRHVVHHHVQVFDILEGKVKLQYNTHIQGEIKDNESLLWHTLTQLHII